MGGVGTIYLDDRKVGEGRIERTQPAVFSADETADVGIHLATPVVETIGAERRSRFTGRIPKVTISVHQEIQAPAWRYFSVITWTPSQSGGGGVCTYARQRARRTSDGLSPGIPAKASAASSNRPAKYASSAVS